MESTVNIFALGQLREIYDDTELAILYDWLGLERPESLESVALTLYEEGNGQDGPSGRVRLMKSDGGYSDENSLSNAVARLVLSKIQDRLPQWAAVYADGRVNLARTYRPKRDAIIEPLPRFLFEINWADSGPGFSWPEAYHVSYLPGFDRYVVTASQDSPDMHGYTDEAIGHFGAGGPVDEGIHRTIVKCWGDQAADLEQHRWAYLLQSGEIDEETAGAWADEVWDEDTAEPLGDLNQRST